MPPLWVGHHWRATHERFLAQSNAATFDMDQVSRSQTFLVFHGGFERERFMRRSNVLSAHQRAGPVIALLGRSIRRALVLCGLLSLAANPAWSQTQDQTVRVTLSKLPPRTSAAYRTLRKRAGNGPIEMLPLTKAELWSVAHDRVASVKAAAARFGVALNELPADWNHLFRPMPVHPSLSAEHKAMMTHGLGRSGKVLPPRAAMVEYALTQDVGSSRDAAKIVLRLNENTLLTLTRTSVDVRSRMCIWRGTVDGTGAPATIMWWPGVTMAGVVQYQGQIYWMRRVRGGVHAVHVVEMSQDRLPPEHAPLPEQLRINGPTLRDDPLIRSGDASELRQANVHVRPQRAGPSDSQTIVQPPGPAGKNSASGETVINVIAAYTSKAATHYADFGRELIDFAIEEANQSFRNSNLGQVQLKLVHAYQTSYVEEGEHFDHLWRFADRDDGYMDEIHGLRERYEADVAMLIVDDRKGCGLATRVFADADEAFAVVHHECAALSYSLAHEIGHLIGARHELVVDGNLTPFPYGHGFVNGSKWRDIMSYKESCGGCPRLPVWSSPNLLVQGEPAGALNADNARVIAEQAARVANFRSSRNNRVHVSAPAADGSRTGAADQPRTRR
jgi:hypothetical protein